MKSDSPPHLVLHPLSASRDGDKPTATAMLKQDVTVRVVDVEPLDRRTGERASFQKFSGQGFGVGLGRELDMQIRQERPEDEAGIRLVTEAAFAGIPHSDQTEARIVDALRASHALTLSLVADKDGDIIGHVAFSPVRIDGAQNWHGLGPVSVKPGEQRKGIGQALIRRGLDMLAPMNSAGCVVFGDPAYYGRFGFECDPSLFYAGAPAGYFQRRVFEGDAPSGEVIYHPSFAAV